MQRWVVVLAALIAVALSLPAASLAQASGPTDALRATVNEVVTLLRDGPSDRRLAIRRVIDGAIDFRAMGERALGRHWAARTPEERTEFVEVFGELLESIYVGEIERARDTSIDYVAERLADGQATVETRVGGKAPTRVDYRMHRQGERWLVYDVLIGGLSIVDNFRSQLNRILRDSSYAEMVAKLREASAGQASGAR